MVGSKISLLRCTEGQGGPGGCRQGPPTCQNPPGICTGSLRGAVLHRRCPSLASFLPKTPLGADRATMPPGAGKPLPPHVNIYLYSVKGLIYQATADNCTKLISLNKALAVTLATAPEHPSLRRRLNGARIPLDARGDVEGDPLEMLRLRTPVPTPGPLRPRSRRQLPAASAALVSGPISPSKGS